MRDISTQIDLSYFAKGKFDQTRLICHRMLASPLRKYVIEKIKDPLRAALEKADSFWSIIVLMVVVIQTANKLRGKVGKLTKENCIFISTHRILEHKERFQQIHHNQGRDKVMLAAYDIWAAVNEHDAYYRYPIGWEVRQIANDMVAGRWPVDTEPPNVLKPCWDSKKEKELEVF